MEDGLNFYFGVIIVMCTFIVIAVGFTIVFIRYQKKLLARQHELHRIELQHKQDLLTNSIQSSETERMRIAKDIHDELGGIFSALSHSLEQIRNEPGVLPQKLEISRSLTNSGLNSVRRISRAMVPFELELFGLEQTLESHFETLSSISSMQVLFENKLHLSLLSNDTALAIYRIIQELTSNCIKYAQADTLTVTITGDDRLLKLLYKDDGVGMPEQHKKNKGIGLKNIESRVLSLNGELEITSAPGEGYTCSITVPLN